MTDHGAAVVVKMIFGSHLYGISTDRSDSDFRGVFLPSKAQLYLGRIPRTLTWSTRQDGAAKNTPGDIDTEMYSLHHFLDLACEGQTVALDMLHAPDPMILETSEIWKRIIAERQRFYTRNLRAFALYARRQASKYGIKGSRLNCAKRVIDFCSTVPQDMRLKQLWEQLPAGEHIVKLPEDANGVRMYEVCGRKLGETTSVAYLRHTVDKFYKTYGARAEQAARNEGIDWKAVSHALRAAYQLKQLFTEKTITYPLAEAHYLRQVKEGRLDYLGEVAPVLERLMDEVEDLAGKSDLPMEADRSYWDDFLIAVIDEHIR